MNGFKRPWHVGVLWNDDPRLPEPLLAELRKRCRRWWSATTSPIRRASSYEYTLTAHARPRALPHCSLEVRQDLIGTPDDGARVGEKADIADRRRRGGRPALTPGSFRSFR